MATSFNGSLGQPDNYSSITELITQWPTAAQNQGIQLSGIAFDGVETNYTNPTVISNLTFATNDNPKSWLTYGSFAGIGVPSTYDGWFTYATKIRAEINHDPNTNQSQVLKVKWADNQDITSATIGISALLPKSSSVGDDQGNEAGVLQLFKDGAPVSASNFTVTRLNAPVTAAKPIVVSSTGVSFISDRIDGEFTFQIVGDSLTGATFDELRFSAIAFDSPTAAYLATSFKDESSDYLVRNIQYQGISTVAPTLPSLFEFAQPNYTVAEGSAVTINVTRTGGTEAASISYQTVDGSASSAGTAGDYTPAVGVLNFDAGQTTASFTVTALTDMMEESAETVNLVLFGGNVGSNPSIVTILDVPPPIPTLPSLFEFAQPNYTVAEGSTVTINVNRTGGTEAAAISYQTVDGSASSAGTAGDYTSVTGVLNFDPGQTTASFTMTALSDMIEESPETVNLVLFGGDVSSNPSIVTINDVPPTILTLPSLFEFAQPNYTVAEGGVVTINVNRTGGTEAASINYSTVDGSASSPADYTSVTGVLNFDPGQTTASFTVTALTDMIEESAETVNLVLFGGDVSSNPSLLTINDVPPPLNTTSPSIFQFAQPNYTVAEGAVATINVTRTGGMGAASIGYQSLNGSASAPDDYAGVVGTLTFAAGQSTASFTVTTVSDTTPESPETVLLTLFGGNVGNFSQLTITDAPPTGTTTPPMSPPMLISASLLPFAEPNYIDPSFVAPTSFFYGSSPDPIIHGGDGVVRANRIGNTSVSPSVDYLIAAPGGQPVNNVDYTVVCVFPVCPTGDTVNFNSGQTSVSLTMNNPLGLASGPVNLGFGPGANVGNPPNTQITLI